MEELRGTYLFDRNAYVASNQPAIFHCHHYNISLQEFILDTQEYLPEVRWLLRKAAHEIAFSQFNDFFSPQQSEDERKAAVVDYFRFAGFGLVDLSALTAEGGEVRTKSEHYGIGWQSKFDRVSQAPIAHFAAGFLAGAHEAIFDLSLGAMDAKQSTCIAMGDNESVFSISPAGEINEIQESQREGTFQLHDLKQPDGTGVDYDAIRNALVGMPIEGSTESGVIDAFGVLLTRHYSNYYCNISYDFLDLFKKKMGDEGVMTAVNLLTEAGHVCAFNTFGGIMQSNEWNGMIKPMLKTKDEWMHGIIAVINSFGWGFWEIDEFTPGKSLRIKIVSGYESNSYIKRYGDASIPVSFLAKGATAGLMNLIYVLDLPSRAPTTLDDTLYKEIHLDRGMFQAEQLKCRAMGDSYDLFEAKIG